MAHAQIVGAIEHAAVGITTTVDQVAVSLGRSHIHGGAVKLLAQDGLGGLRAKVAQEHHQSVDAVGLHVIQSLQGVGLILHRDGALIEALSVGGNDILAALCGQSNGKTVARHGDDTELYFRNVHIVFSFTLQAVGNINVFTDQSYLGASLGLVYGNMHRAGAPGRGLEA